MQRLLPSPASSKKVLLRLKHVDRKGRAVEEVAIVDRGPSAVVLPQLRSEPACKQPLQRRRDNSQAPTGTSSPLPDPAVSLKLG